MTPTRTSRRSAGTCETCGQVLEKAGMARHLASCRRAQAAGAPPAAWGDPAADRAFHLLVEGQGLAAYWIHLAAPARKTLEDLDEFLRKLGLECCGHLSAFFIDGVEYLSEDPEQPRERPMNIPLGRVLRPGMILRYEYDFGSTTELRLRVLAERPAAAWTSDIVLLARNEAPRIPCVSCGRPATRVTAGALASALSTFCADCAYRRGHGRRVLLPLLNSPRAGICAYGGALRTRAATRRS